MALTGAHPIPWQRHAAHLLGERLPNGLPAFPRAVVIVPRRAGKTRLMLGKGLATGAGARYRRSFYASHRRETAAAMWVDDWFPWVEDGPLARHVKVVRGKGGEALIWRRTRSTLRLLPPDGDAMRSFASNLAILDEAREWTVDQGDAAERGVFPTQATGVGGQTLIVSSAGTAKSAWLRKWVDLGRASALAGRTDGIAHIEYAAPVDADPYDEATWWLGHPGLGHHVNIEALRADAEVMTPDAFGAEYLGWWPETLIDSKLVDAWSAHAADVDLADPVVFAVEVDDDREWCDIVAVGDGPGGGVVVELVEHRPHGPWVGPRLAELVERWSPLAVAYDRGGPAAALGPDLADVPARLVSLNTPECTAAAGWFYDAVTKAGTVWHRADDVLDAAITAARRRRAGGSWLFDRRQPGAGPLIAASLAAWVHRDGTHRPPGVS
jgi:hypothetical protein